MLVRCTEIQSKLAGPGPLPQLPVTHKLGHLETLSPLTFPEVFTHDMRSVETN